MPLYKLETALYNTYRNQKWRKETQPLLSAVDEQVSYAGESYTYNRSSGLDEQDRDASLSQRSELPQDRLNMAYLIFYLQGLGMLLPWNFFITARSYFEYKYRSNQAIVHTFESAFSVASMVPNLLSLFLNVLLTKRVSRNIRISLSLAVTLLIMVVTVIFVRVDTSTWTSSFFSMTIVTIVIVNISIGISQSSFFGLAGILGPRYTQAVMGGQGISGIVAAAADIFIKLSHADVISAGFIYFLSAVAFLLVCIFGYVTLFGLPFVSARLRQRDLIAGNGVNPVNADSDPTESQGTSISRTTTPYWSILCQISRMAFSVCFIFFVTLAAFPAVCSGIKSMDASQTSRWGGEFFTPVVCFLLFNVCDYLGRFLAGLVQFPGHQGPWLAAISFSRVIFIPLFCLCNYQPRHQQSTVLFTHDAYPIVIMILFALSNGYFGSLCMMYGPKMVPPEHSEVAGTIMVFFLTLGLAMGSGFSVVLVTLLKG